MKCEDVSELLDKEHGGKQQHNGGDNEHILGCSC